MIKESIVTFVKSGVIARVTEKTIVIGKCERTGVDLVKKDIILYQQWY